MTKQDIIADIRLRNHTASEEFLASFKEEDLLAYLSNLQEVVPVPAAQEHRRSQSRHCPTDMSRPIRGPLFRSYKPYMGRPTQASTISCAKRRRNYVQLS
jgi:hypothetical protein